MSKFERITIFKEYHVYSNELMEEYNKLFFDLKNLKSFESGSRVQTWLYENMKMYFEQQIKINETFQENFELRIENISFIDINFNITDIPYENMIKSISKINKLHSVLKSLKI